MRSRRGLLTVLTIALLSLLAAGPAAAGGPTSVLLVSPGSGRTASLYVSDADYTLLSDLVGADASDTAGDPSPSGAPGHDEGTAVTLTWLLHDVQVWRIDSVHLNTPGGPWVSTRTEFDGSGNITSRQERWHQVTRGKELVALLDRLGVGPGAAARTSAPAAQPTTQEAAAPVRPVAAAPAAPASGTGGVAWALAGLTVGVLATLAALAGGRAARRRGYPGGTPRRAAGTT